MRKSLFPMLVIAAVVTAVFVSSSGGAAPAAGHRFKIIEEDESAAFGDVAPRAKNKSNPRFSGGDLHVFTSRLFDEKHKRVGRLYAECTTVRAGKTFVHALFQCNATMVLHDGTIAVNTAFAGNQRDEDVLSAVTGGTGAYEGARGQISQRNLPHGRMENRIHLLP